MSYVRRWGIIVFASSWSVGILMAGSALTSIRPVGIISGSVIGLAVVIIGTYGIIHHRNYLLIAVLIGSLAFCSGVIRMIIDENQTVSPLNQLPKGTSVSLQGIISAEPDAHSTGENVTVDIHAMRNFQTGKWQPIHGTVSFFWPLTTDQQLNYGDMLNIQGQILAPYSQAHPAANIRVKAQTIVVTQHDQGLFFLKAIHTARQSIARRIQMILPAPEAALLIGILLGLKTPYLRDHLADFTTTGTIHIVVTSGLKVTYMGAMIYALLRRAPNIFRLSGGMLAIIAYVLLSGAGPAAWRAGIMGCIALMANIHYRDYDLYSALAFTIIVMTGIDPLLYWDAGFQLSVVGTLGISLLAPRILMLLHAFPFISHIPISVSDALATTIAAQIATMPILIATFGIVAWISPLANLLLVPLLPLFLGFGILAALSSLAPLAGTIIGAIIWMPLHLAARSISLFAQIPWGSSAISIPLDWAIPLWVGCISILPLIWKFQIRPAAKIRRSPMYMRSAQWLVSVSILFVTGISNGAILRSNTASVSFLKAGGGGPATLILSRNGSAILIDGGDSSTALLDALASHMPPTIHTIDLIIVTDTRDGHIKGLEGLTSYYTIRAVATPGVLHPTITYAMWHNSWQKLGIRFLQLSQGDAIPIQANIGIHVLWGNGGNAELVDGTGQQDINSIIFNLTAGNDNFVFLGDADAIDIQQIIPVLPTVNVRAIQIGDYIPDDLTRTQITSIIARTSPQTVVIVPSARISSKKRNDSTQTFMHNLIIPAMEWQTQVRGTLTIPV